MRFSSDASCLLDDLFCLFYKWVGDSEKKTVLIQFYTTYSFDLEIIAGTHLYDNCHLNTILTTVGCQLWSHTYWESVPRDKGTGV